MILQDIIHKYELESHPEGGWFKEVYRSDIESNNEFGENRNLLTSIYFLLTDQNISKLHSIQSDELWYYHTGSALTVHCISPLGKYYQLKIGPNINNGEHFQALVPKGTIFGSTVDKTDSYSFVGCAVAPGFDFKDFKLYNTQELLSIYPEHELLIKRLT